MSQKVVFLPGDGIGKEVAAGARQVLDECSGRHQLNLQVEEYDLGGTAIDKHGEPLPQFVLDACLESKIVFLGAVGDPRFDASPPHLRPEKALLGLRKALELFANLRPIRTYSELIDASTLKREVIEDVDILIVRELTGGIYFGEPRGLETRSGNRVGFNTEIYADYEVERISRIAFEASRLRSGRVTSVDKSNVLESSQLWRVVVEEVAKDYSDVKLDHLLIDNCAMQLVARPRSFDVLLTNNMFGDILSDEAAMLTGSIGMLPSASVGATGGEGRVGLYEPVHGSAPDIAGQDKANPLAAIGCVALLFRYSLDRDDIACQIEQAIEKVLSEGIRTGDIAVAGSRVVGTCEMVDAVLERL
ncbi:MAG: 3-isopropylmalate dehydrogenase [Acidobacteriota bacterium]|nr:MAG: 3-isopropylmalate dehydrogenase [Acidobacteriota bacterium]